MTKRWGPQTVGHYVIERPIGRGNMGVVYLAHPQGADDFKVALKVINSSALSPEDAESIVKRWRVEYSTMRKVKHPNVVSIIHPGVDAETNAPYIAMEHVQGQNLASCIRQGDLDIRRALNIAQGVAYGTHELHKHGIVHRDLKPQNVMVDEDDNPVILDFGISIDTEILGRITSPGTVLGTPGYVAPEIMLTGDTPTSAADVYGLGVLAYTALGGRHPRIKPQTSLTAETLEKLTNLDLDQLVTLHGRTHDYLPSVIEPLLERKPENRPTALEAAELFGWGLKKANHADTKQHQLPSPNRQLWSLYEEVATLSRDEFLDLNQDISGILISAHCFGTLGNPTMMGQSCNCVTHCIKGMSNRSYSLGREGDIRVYGDQVSRRHASISIPGFKATTDRHYKAVLRDLDSTNGTYVNNRQVTSPHILSSGDVVGLGQDSLLSFVYLADFYDVVSKGSNETRISNRA